MSVEASGNASPPAEYGWERHQIPVRLFIRPSSLSMRAFSVALGILLLVGFLAGCGGDDAAVVESGTYTGTITEVNAEEREIYVDVPQTGTVELYFVDSTRVLRDTTEVSFDALQTNQTVTVEIEKVGQRLDPVTVTVHDGDS